MGNMKEITTIEDGELKVKTALVSGTRVSTSEIDKKKYITTLVQTEDGEELAVKVTNLGGGGGGGYVLPTATASRLGGIKVGENLTVEADGTLNAQVGGGGTATVSWFDNQSGFSVNTGLEIPSSARVQVYKNGKLLQAGTPLTFRHYKGGSGHSVYLTSVAPISTANSWRLEFREHWTPGLGNLPSLLAGAGTTDCQAPSICVDGTKLGYFLSDNGSLWSIAYGSQSSLLTPAEGTKFDIAMEFTGSEYHLLYKLADSDIWTTVQTTTSSLKAYCADAFRFLFNKLENGNNYSNASTLYWETVKIIIDGQTWFDGATAVAGTDFVNDGCTLTEIAGSTKDYTIDTTTGVISFGQELFNDDIAVEVITSESGSGGTSDYTDLTNKPSINSVTLTGNKTASDLGLLTPETGLQNTATGSNSVTILGTPATSTYSVNIGLGSQAINDNSIAIGTSTRASGSIAIGAQANAGANASVAIGKFAWSSQQKGISLGYSASCTGEESIQIGTGTNSTAKTLQVYTYQLLDGNTGLIPTDRMARVVELTTTSVELASDTVYNGAELASVTFTLPATVPANFTAQLNFTSGATATTFTAPATVTFEGNDCSNGVFTPLASKRYSVMVYSDGVNVIGLVMGN